MMNGLLKWCQTIPFYTQPLLRPSSIYQSHRCKHLISDAQNRIRDDKQHEEDNPKEKHVVKVAVLGVPNAGKSTFINNLINHRVCPTSRKVHTTRQSSKAVYNKSNTQLILFDTPGMVDQQGMKKHNLGDTFNRSCRRSISEANLIAVLQDVSNPWTRNQLHPTIVETLEMYSQVPSVLILNKIDLLRSKRILLDLARLLTENTLEVKDRRYTVWKGGRTSVKFEEQLKRPVKYKVETSKGWPKFSDIFMVSALNGEGLNAIMKTFLSHAKAADWDYGSGEFSDQSVKDLILNSVRARLLDFLNQEIPYNLRCEMDYLETEDDKIVACVNVICPTERIERIVCGQKDGKLRQITELITSDLVATFQQAITLTLSTSAKS